MKELGSEKARRTHRWLIVGLLVATAFVAAPSFASADSSTGTPTVWPDKPSYAPGDVASISASGFVAGDTVSVSLSDSLSGWTSPTVDETVASDGTFAGAPLALPSTFSSSITATATDTTTGDTASAPVMETTPVAIFTPTITTDQTDYAPGSTVTITGSGWPGGDNVSVQTSDASGGSWSQTDNVTTDSSGGFTDQVTLPLMAISNYTVTASDANGLTAATTFTDSTNIHTTTSLAAIGASTAGSSVSWSGAVTPDSGTMPTGGTVTLSLFSHTDCTGVGTILATTSQSGGTNSSPATYSSTFTAPAAGSYGVQAHFGGVSIGSGGSAINWQSSNSTCQAITVNSAAATKLVFTTSAQTLTAGVTSGTVTVQRQDQSGNPTTSGSTTVDLSTTSGGGIFRDTGDTTTITQVTISGGSSSASFRYKDTVAGTPTITAADHAGTLTSATQQETVNPAGLDHFNVSAPASTTAGSPFSVTATAKDAYANTVTSYTGTIHFTLSDSGSAASKPGNYTFTTGLGNDNGSHTFTSGVTLVTAGSQSITVNDTVLTSKTGTTNVTVSPGPLDHFDFNTISNQTAGSQFSVTATAKDAYGNTKTSYAGGATLSGTLGNSPYGCAADHTTVTSGGSYSCHPSYDSFGTWTSGSASANVTGYNAESGDTLTATDSLITGTSNSFNIGHAAANQIALSGSTGDLASGATRVLTATIEDAYGNVVNTGPDANESVNFAYDASTGAGTVTGLGSSTAALGVATKTVTGVLVGSVTIKATVTGLSEGTGNPITFKVVPASTSTVLTAPSPVQYSDPETLTATVSPTSLGNGQTISGSVTFYANYGTISQVTLNSTPAAVNSSTGVATASPSITLAPSTTPYPITAIFTSSNPQFADSASEPKDLTVNTEDATLGYTGNLFVSTGSASATSTSVTLTGQVNPETPSDGYTGDLSKAKVQFVLYKSTDTTMSSPQYVPATVSSTGVVTSAPTTLNTDNWTVMMQFVSGSYYTGPESDPVVLTIYTPTTGQFATGGGWVIDPSLNNLPVAVSSANQHGNFGFSVKYKSSTTPMGQAVYVFRGSNGYDYVIKSNSWSGGGLSFGAYSNTSSPYNGASTASFSGKCNITVMNPATGQVVTALSSGNDTYRVDTTDGSSLGLPDKYAITVYNGSNAIYHEVATTWGVNTALPGNQIPLGGGNLTVHIK